MHPRGHSLRYIDGFILDRIDSKKTRLESMLLDQASLKRIQWNILIEYVFNSNAIEGSRLTLYDTRMILETSKDIMAHPTYFQYLAINHTNVFDYIRRNMREKITSKSILDLHSVTMKYIDKEAGVFRDKNTGNKIEPRLEGFLEKLNRAEDYHPIERSALIIGIIHQLRPFNYGVGTTSRLAAKWLLNQNGYVFGLPLNPYEVKYYRKCAEKAGKGTIQPLANILSMCVEETMDQLITQVKSLNIMSINEAMRSNNLNPAQMLESIKRGDFRAFKKDGAFYVTDVRVDKATHGSELINEIQ